MSEQIWLRDIFPEMLWIDAVLWAEGFGGVYAALDVLDRFVPEEETAILDGTLGAFNLIPPADRPAAVTALAAEAPSGLPEDLGHGLLLYPNCPAAWLYDGISEDNLDRQRGVKFLTEATRRNFVSHSGHSTELRMAWFARYVKHQRISIPAGVPDFDLFPRYPDDLTEDERGIVRAMVRSIFLAMRGAREPAEIATSREWAQVFWRENIRLSPCKLTRPYRDDDVDEESAAAGSDHTIETGVAEEPADATESDTNRPIPSVGRVRNVLLDALHKVGSELATLQLSSEPDLYDRVRHEVLLGLASRQLRLFGLLVRDPMLWTFDAAPHVLRPLAEGRITASWLISRNEPAMYQKFKDYGMGKRKLYKLQLEARLDDEQVEDEGLRAHIDQLEAEINAERWEELQEIDLGASFSGVSLYTMATEADHKELYTLIYQVLSSETHGEWGSVMSLDLQICGNPLHGGHRVGAFDLARSPLSLEPLRIAMDLAEDCIVEIFDSIGVDAHPPLEEFHATVIAAIQPPETTGNSSSA